MIKIIDKISEIPDSDIQHQFDNLPLQIQEHVDRYKLTADRHCSIVAWDILINMLLEQGINASKLILCIGERGKPYFLDCPYNFSISHSGDCVVVAVSDRNIGVDIQHIDDKYLQVKGRVCSDAENDSIKSAEDFVRLWTLKEATVKNIGIGIATDLKQYDFSSFNSESFCVYNKKYISYPYGEYYIAVCENE